MNTVRLGSVVAWVTTSAAQSSHHKIAATTVARSGFAAIPLEKPQGFLKSWAWPLKSCRTFGVLCEGSSAGLLLCKPSCRTSCRTPKVPQNSGLGGGGAQTRLLRTGLLSSQFVFFLCERNHYNLVEFF